MRTWSERSAMIRLDVFSGRLTRSLTLLLIAIAVIGADQLSKYLIRSNMELGESIPSEGFVRLTYTTNTGGAFGLFTNQTFLLSLVAIIGVAVVVIYLHFLPMGSRLLKVGLGLNLGGAIGNLIDRIRLGEVTDFLDFGAWPVFNLADSAIVVGTFLIAFHLLFFAATKKPNI